MAISKQRFSIPPCKPYFPPDDIQWILGQFEKILEGYGYLSQSKYCQQFEKEWAEYIGVKYAMTVSNGTVALEAILRAINVKDKEVIVPTNTFAATAFAVIHAGGIPVFADIDRNFQLSLYYSMLHNLTEKTGAIIIVHVGGFVSDIINQSEISLYDTPLVEDAAQAHGSMLNGEKAGSFGKAAGFSFYSTKDITMGEGGIVTTDDDEIAEKIRLWRDQAKVRKGIYQNIHEQVGFNWRLTEVQALMGIAQLQRLEEFICERTRIAKIFDEQLIDYRIPIAKGCRPNWYKYPIIPPMGKTREQIKAELKQRGISLAGFVYEIPLHQQPVFRGYVRWGQRFPVADELCARHVCLPIYPTMTDEEAVYVAESVKDVIE